MSLVSEFRTACTISTFLESKNLQCSAHKINLDLHKLAIFKYLLPDEITYTYEDTPSDTVFGDVPDQILVFKFNATKQISKRKLPQVVDERVALFEHALNMYLRRHGTLTTLSLHAKEYIPYLETVDLKEDLNVNALSLLSEVVNEFCVVGKHAEFAETEFSKFTNFKRLFKHQSLALNFLTKSCGNHLVVSTPTASGKSLIFQSFIRYILNNDKNATCMLFYPTKALSQDQLRSLKDINAYTFDGDTSYEERLKVKQNAQVLLLNPDILSMTILPNWQEFSRILSNLRCVVVDEVHLYTGVFGTNVALILRRLRRILHVLGVENCQFIACSATVAQPTLLFTSLTGIKNNILALGPNEDTSPKSNKTYVFCQPKRDAIGGGFLHPISEAAPLMARLVKQNKRVIAFCRTRKECELLLRAVYEIDQGLTKVIKGYRGGYNKTDRREIESLMFNEQLNGIVATSALEIGIDIGSLDAAIIVGFPSNVSSFRQQAGRVGRRNKESLIVFIAGGSIIDQSYLHNTDKLVFEDIQTEEINFNEQLVIKHIQAAAYELPMETPDFSFFPKVNWNGKLEKVSENCYAYPYKPSINIRQQEDDQRDVVVVFQNKILETVDLDRVSFTLYEGAIFMHQGKAYLVTKLDPDMKYAEVSRTHVKWTTKQRDFTDVDPIGTSNLREINGVVAGLGTILITTKVFGYFKFNEHNRIIGEEEVCMPPMVKHRRGTYINLNSQILSKLNSLNHMASAAIHAAEHALIAVMPEIVKMDVNSLMTECKAPEKELYAAKQTSRLRPARLIFYERSPGQLGIGIADDVYTRFEEIIKRAQINLDNCECEDGCQRCIGAGECVEQHIVLSKEGAKVILRMLVGVDLEGVKVGEGVGKVETVVVV